MITSIGRSKGLYESIRAERLMAALSAINYFGHQVEVRLATRELKVKNILFSIIVY